MQEQIIVPRGVMGVTNVPDGYHFVQCRCCSRRVWILNGTRHFGRWCVSCTRGYAGH